MRPLLLPSILILVWIFNHNINKNKDNDKPSIRSYLEREDAANSTRRKKLDNLDYISVPLASFPFDITLKDEKKQIKIQEYKKELERLAQLPMLNLLGVSNTELKEQYGPANLEILTSYDQHYIQYLRTLQQFAQCIYDEYPKEAASLLEYCLSIGTDLSGTYALLGEHYIRTNDTDHFYALYDSIPDKDSLSGKIIVRKLDELKLLL